MIFYQGKMFPKKYRGQIFIAEHGSWNRSKKSGYRISWSAYKEIKQYLIKVLFRDGQKTKKYMEDL